MNNLYIVQQTEYGPDCVLFISADTEVDNQWITFHFSSGYSASCLFDVPSYNKLLETAKRVIDKFP